MAWAFSRRRAIAAIAFSCSLAACGAPFEASEAACEHGAMRACSGPGACSGQQACDRAGQWGPCDCGTTSGGGSGGSGGNGSTGVGGDTSSASTGSGGSGGVSECKLPEASCDGDPDTGCEANLHTSRDHCGACDAPCAGGCQQGKCVPPKTVFVTSSHHDGNLGGLAGADAICMARAEEAGLSGNYMAWLSDGVSWPAKRMTAHATAYVATDGVLVAESFADLLGGSLHKAIDRTESGEQTNFEVHYICEGGEVWTSTKPDGTALLVTHCAGWTTTVGVLGAAGNAKHADGRWTESCPSIGCSAELPLYCVEQ